MTNNAGKEGQASARIAIVYASVHHGNTRQIADLFAAQLHADLWTVDEARGKCLQDYRLIGLGSGIYFGRHHESLLSFVDSWEQAPERVFLFSTAGLPFLRMLQHWALRQRVIRKGASVAGEFCCRGWDTVGPLWLIGGLNRKHPSTLDFNRAGKFADRLLKH